MTVEQPAGSVTLVFTDIEGSTRLLRELGEGAYRDALAQHRSRVREAFGRHGGYEVDYEGDSFFYAFASPTEAAQAVGEAVTALEDGPIRIRVGVHSGTPGLDPPKYVGLDVHKAQRVMAAGHGGQVVLSHGARELLGDGFPVRYLGEYRLRDLPQPERLYQLGAGEFPPLRTLYHTNLPRPATTFVGRERELSELTALLRNGARLVTLTGPGGSGKTRLALQAAAAVTEEFPDGIWWLPLAPLREPSLVLLEVARVLEINQPGRELAEVLAEVFAGKRTLMLLDNAEHLLPEAAVPLAQLRDFDGPKLVVTSRERLQLAGEHVYEVPPLAEHDGLNLFSERAREVNASFEPGPALEQLCARLDQLPLALELAAARTSVLSPEQIIERLSQRLDLLKAGRDAEARQRTLRSTIEWSYDLLDPEERALFARLAVFAGGCTLHAAEQICNADLDTLAALADKSLLRRSGERYWLLETIREYAAERLHESDAAGELRRRHAGYYERFATEARQGMRGAAAGTWLNRLRQELPNLRSAMEFSLTSGEPAVALRASTALERFWHSADPAEGRIWLDRALGARAGTPAERAEGSLLAAFLALFHGEGAKAVRLAQTAIELAAAAGDDETRARALGYCGTVLAEQGNDREALALMRRCRELASGLADPWARAEALRFTAGILTYTGDPEQAAIVYEDVLRKARELGDELLVGLTLTSIGYSAMLRGELDESRSAHEGSLRIAQRLSARSPHLQLGNLGLVAVLQGRYGDALALLGEALRLCSSSGDRRIGAETLLGLAAAHAALGNLELAAKLDAIRTEIDAETGIVYPRAFLDQLEPHLRVAREHSDPAIIAALSQDGRKVTLDTAIAELERDR